MELKKLHELTKEWSHDRGILTNGKVTTQALKLISEFGELCTNLANERDIKDDIGDMLVVSTNLANLDGYSLLDLFDAADELRHMEQGIMSINGVLGDLCDNAAKGDSVKAQLTELLWHIGDLARFEKVNINECWEIAYNDIKDRKGFLNKNGNFIKSTDPKYKQLKMAFDKSQKAAKNEE